MADEAELSQNSQTEAAGTPPGEVSAASSVPTPADVSSTAPPAASPEYTDLRDIAAQVNPELAQRFTDSTALASYLLQAERERRELAARLQGVDPVVRDYSQNAAEFRRWREEQQRAQQEKQAREAQWFKAPDWDPRWRSMLEQDPQTGQLRPRADAPPDVVQKYLAGVQHQRDFLEKFAFDPVGAIKPGIQQLIREEAQRLVGEQVGQVYQRQQVGDFIRSNPWIVERDAEGNERLSAWGQRLQQHVQRAVELGITNLQAQQDYAMALIQADWAKARAAQPAEQQAAPAQQPAAQQPAAQPQAAPLSQNEQQKRAFAAQPAAHSGNRAGSAAEGGAHSAGRAKRANLQNRMAEAFYQAGLTKERLTFPG